jgi:hypothetical protein
MPIPIGVLKPATINGLPGPVSLKTFGVSVFVFADCLWVAFMTVLSTGDIGAPWASLSAIECWVRSGLGGVLYGGDCTML